MNRFSALRDEFAEHRRRWGWRRTLHALLMRALHRSLELQLFVLHVREHAANPPPVPLAAGRKVRLLDADDLARASADPRLEMPAPFLRDALARGDFCVGALEGDRLIAYVWRAFGPTPVPPDLWIHFGLNHRYGYKGFTLPQHRGQRLQDAVSYATDRLCLERGRTHAVAFVETHNFASLIADRRRGNVVSGYALSARLFGRRILWNSPGARRTGVRLARAAGEPLGSAPPAGAQGSPSISMSSSLRCS